MADVLNPETLVYFFLLIVPGFIAVKTYDLLVPTERRNFGEMFVDLIAYSSLVLVIWSLPLFALVSNRELLGRLYFPLFGLAIVLIIFVSPVIVAIVGYKIRTSEFLRGRITHPSPTGWDWFFGEEPRRCFVLFHLESGEIVGGFFGENSSASSYPHDQQVYIEEVWELGDNLEFVKKVEQTNGAIIDKDDCNVVELFVYEEEGGDGGDQKK